MQIKSLSGFFRRMLFATVAIFACALVFLAAKTVVFNINAVTPNNGEVLLKNNANDWGIIDRDAVGPGFTPANIDYIPYGNDGGTGFYQVVLDNGSGATLPAVCAQPSKIGIRPGDSKGGVGAAKMEASEATNAIILMMYLYSNYQTENNLATATLDMLFEGGSYKLSQVEAANINRYSTNGSLGSYYDALIYAYTHAVVGALHGDMRYLSNNGMGFVEQVISGLNGIISRDDYIWAMAKNSQAYGVNKSSLGPAVWPDGTQATVDDWQNFAWIEATYGNLAIRKCMKGTGNECLDPRSGTDFDGIAFEIYNNTGGKIYWHGRFFEDNDNEPMNRYVLTDGNPTITIEDLPTGKYKVKELNGNTWYDVNTTPEYATVTADAPVTVRFFNSIKKDGLTVYKKDKETNDCSTLGKATFVGTKFTVRDSNNQVVATKTMAAGECSVTFTGLEYGVYTIEETEVGNGYSRYIYTKTVTVPPTSGGSASETFNNQVIRGDVTFKKVNENGRPMENIPFMIRSKTTGEEHRVVTNINGIVNTAASFIPHTTSTNGYDSLNINTITYRGFGTWFGGTTADNSLGALPYDDYEVFELECDHNQLCRDIASRKNEFTISSDKQLVDLGTFNNDCGASVSTSATDNKDGDKFVEADAAAKIKDTLTYQAKPGLSLTIKGKLMDKSTGQSLKINNQEITATKTVTVPASGSGTETLVFSLDASTIAGKDIVVYEELYFGAELIAEHKEMNDANQTVTIVSISTSASDNADDDKFVEAGTATAIKDTVTYCAKAGGTFIISGVLMDKKSGEVLLINDKPITAEKTVTLPADGDGCNTEELVFDLDSTTIAGKEIVVFDELYQGDTVVAEHKDINDVAQTVTIISLSTVATDNLDEDKYIEATKGQKVRDVVNYCVKSGQDFTIKGVLMDKSTGKELLIDGHKFEQETVVNSDEGCGSVTLIFPLDATMIAGIDVVVFEYMYYEDELILSHNYFDDAEQTTSMISLFTYATNEKGDEKIIVTGEKSIIKDKIKYALKAGSRYTIKGVLVDKETGKPILVDGKKVENSIEIDTTKSAVGETEMIYEFDSTGLEDKEIVIFDEVYENGVLILSHTDINNTNQTVKFVAPAPDSGMLTVLFGGGAVANSMRLGSILGGAAVVFYLTRRHLARKVKVNW